jgi:membrane fusion protein
MSDGLLFRQEAIEFQQHNRQWGQIAFLQPLSHKLTTWFLTTFVAIILIFLLKAEYARKETVVEFLTSTSGTSKIFAPHQGTIREIYVKEGDQVENGHPLLTVQTNQIAADGRDVNATVLETLSSQRELLIRQISAEEERTKSERERLSSMVRRFETEISQLEVQIKTQGERIAVAEDFVSSAAGLRAKGYIADVEFKRRQMALLEQKQNQNSLNQQLAARQNQLTETRHSLEQLSTVMGGKIQSVRNELASLQQRIAEVNGRQAYVIRAPAAGRVSTVQATVGQFADSRRLQMEIVPNESVLRAELFVPTRAIGFIEAGQRVRILYEAFPYQQFGTYSGSVIKVSQTILTASDTAGPIALKEPAYRVTAAIDRPDIDAYGKRMPLQADMLLRADIVLEKRSLMRWLLDPVLSIRM